MDRIAGNQVTIKENNQKLIIDTLVKKGATSRADLAKMLKLSAPSVSKNINHLLKKKLLLEIGEGDSIGGRRPIILEFNYNYGYIIGIDLSSEDVRIALGNLKSEILEIRTIDISAFKNGKKILEIVADNIISIIEKNNLKLKQILVIALGSPGIINDESGRLLVLPSWLYFWKEVNIKEELKKKFKAIEVIVNNDINLAALGECCYGVGKNYQNLVYVSVGMGVGAGIILNNKLYEGIRLAAGEIGYFASSIRDINFDNKNVGPFESRIAMPAIIEKVKKSLSQGRKSIISELIGGDVNKLNEKTIEKAIDLKDPFIIEEIEQVVNELGIVLANISILLDLELIILGGKIIDLNYNFLEPLNEIIQKITPFNTKVINSSLEHNAVIYGAFSIALEHIHNNILK